MLLGLACSNYILNKGLLVQGFNLEVQLLWQDLGTVKGSRSENSFGNLGISEMLKSCVHASFYKEKNYEHILHTWHCVGY